MTRTASSWSTADICFIYTLVIPFPTKPRVRDYSANGTYGRLAWVPWLHNGIELKVAGGTLGMPIRLVCPWFGAETDGKAIPAIDRDNGES